MSNSKEESSDILSGPVEDELLLHGSKRVRVQSHSKTSRPSVYKPINTLNPISSPPVDDCFSSSFKNRLSSDPQVLTVGDSHGDTKAILTKSTYGFRLSPKKVVKPVYEDVHSNEKGSSNVSSLLYPDDKYSNLALVDDTPNSIDILYIACGHVKLADGECNNLQLDVSSNNRFMLHISKIGCEYVSCSLDRSNVHRVIMYAGPKRADNLQVIDFFYIHLPIKLVKLGFEGDSNFRIRVVLKEHRYVVENSAQVVFNKVEMSREWFVDEPAPTNDIASNSLTKLASLHDEQYSWRRQSSRLLSKPLTPHLSSSGFKNSTDTPIFKPRRSFRSILADIREPELPEKPVPLFVYPESGIGAVTITTADTPRLESAVFLNDNIVDFDLRYLMENVDTVLRKRFHLFSSFLYKKLTDDGQSGVRGWTDEVDIFAKDFLIVPICDNLHWYLAIICYPGRLTKRTVPGETSSNPIEVQESCQDSEPSSCCILIFDSLGRPRHPALNRLKTYLVDEAKDKMDHFIHREHIQGVMVKCPHQTNYTDCGLFCCHFFEYFLKDPDVAVAKANNHELTHWFPPAEAMNRRQTLKERIAMIASTSTYHHIEDNGNSSDIEEIICLDS